MARKKKTKREKVLRYIIKHRSASVKEVAKACGCTVKYVYDLKAQSGTPKEVIEKELNVQPVVTETFKDYSGNEYSTYALKEVKEATDNRVRSETLREAESLVSGDREKEHGEFWKNAYLTSRLWQGYTGWDIQPEQVPVMLALLKIARSVGANQHESSGKDNFVDACGYLALAAELDQFNPEDI